MEVKVTDDSRPSEGNDDKQLLLPPDDEEEKPTAQSIKSSSDAADVDGLVQPAAEGTESSG